MTSPITSAALRWLPSLDGPRNPVPLLWDRLSPLPGGARLFSHLVGHFAPYSGSINARVVELRPGLSRVKLPDHATVRNHLRSIHAVALVNLAEFGGNLAFYYAIPDNTRFIVAGLSIEYLKKARGMITATSTCPIPENNERREYQVSVQMHDTTDDLVAHATLRVMVGPRHNPT